MRLLSAHFSTVVIILFISHLPISTSSNLSLGGVDRSEPLHVCTGLIATRSLAAVIRKLFFAAQQFFPVEKNLDFLFGAAGEFISQRAAGSRIRFASNLISSLDNGRQTFAAN
jgi:hypothetical protein